MKPIKAPSLLKPGDDLIMRNGTPCRFVAYVPDAGTYCRLVAMEKDVGNVVTRHGNGRVNSEEECMGDIGLPPEKKTVWVNVYGNESWSLISSVYESEQAADEAVGNSDRIGGKAWPLEIEI